MTTSNDGKLTPHEVLIAYQRLMRHWIAFLSLSEFRVLSWLVSMAVGWFNRSCEFSMHQMLHGVPDRDTRSQWHARPIGLSHVTLRAALKSLHQKGVIASRKGRYSTVYTINLGWNPEASEVFGDESCFSQERKKLAAEQQESVESYERNLTLYKRDTRTTKQGNSKSERAEAARDSGRLGPRTTVVTDAKEMTYDKPLVENALEEFLLREFDLDEEFERYRACRWRGGSPRDAMATVIKSLQEKVDIDDAIGDARALKWRRYIEIIRNIGVPEDRPSFA